MNDGNGFVFVDHVGNICPSGFLPMVRGNVRDGALVDVYRNDSVFRQLRDPGALGGRCGRCRLRAVCGGSRSGAFSATGDPFASDPLCLYENEGVEDLISNESRVTSRENWFHNPSRWPRTLRGPRHAWRGPSTWASLVHARPSRARSLPTARAGPSAEDAALDSPRVLCDAGRVSALSFARPLTARFLPGTDLESALRTAGRLHADGFGVVFTRLTGSSDSADAALEARAHYLHLVDRLAPLPFDAQLSVNPLALRLGSSSSECLSHLDAIVGRAHEAGIIISLVMESSRHVDPTLALFRTLRRRYDNLAVCLQANLARTPDDLEELLPFAPAVRLCKGGFRGRRHAALEGAALERQYLALARRLLGREARAAGVRAAFATHDRSLIEGVRQIAVQEGARREAIEFQMVYGVETPEQRRLRAAGCHVRVLVSYGPASLRWFITRLITRPSNLRHLAER